MVKYKNKTALILGISYSLALIAVLCGYIISGYSEAAQHRLMIANSYSSAITDLSGYMMNISDNLEKELYCSTPEQLSSLSADISADSACAKECLENLPVSSEYTSGIYKFCSQAGDYSKYLVKQASSQNGGISNDERGQLKKLSVYSSALSSKISDVQAVACDNEGENCAYWDNEIKSMLKSADSNAKITLSSLNTSAQDISQSETNYPTLIYDGPFSDHMQKGTAKYIANEKMISADNARKRAADFFGCKESEIDYKSTDNANVKCYIFSGKDDASKTVSVTQNGGKLMYLNNNREVKQPNIDEKTAIRKAKQYLKMIYKCDFIDSYYMIDNNICVINMAYYENNITFYSDLIKVGIALDNGDIVSVESAGFIMNHHDRSIHFTKTLTQTKECVSKYLSVKSSAKCVINLGTDKEYACYEFTCKGENNEDILVYIDAVDLSERNILILQKTDGGILTR